MALSLTPHKGQYGSRPGCEAQFLTLIEELKYDISYLTRQNIFNFDNDAIACYDQIIVALALLVALKCGQHYKVVVIHTRTLEEAEYFLKMANQLSPIASDSRGMVLVKVAPTLPTSGSSSLAPFLTSTQLKPMAPIFPPQPAMRPFALQW